MTRLLSLARSLSLVVLAAAGVSATAHAATMRPTLGPSPAPLGGAAPSPTAAGLGLATRTSAATAPGPVITVRRFALVVGANDGGTDRVVLRYAGTDAEAVSAVLERFGGVAQGDLVRLSDPTPEQLLDAIEGMSVRIRAARIGGQHVQFVFYYSGHSDEQGLLLGGRRVAYRDLRRDVQAVPADVRIAVLDSCASGAFTRTKGGTKRAPFLVSPAAEVKGHAFLTSSSVDEAAQESDRVGGSFFTHYFTTGLRGAADVDGDRLITLSEAYEFAFDETLARTEATRGGAQHAAYDIQLAGSGDLVMTDLRETSARLELPRAIGGRISVRTPGGALAAELYKPPGSAPMELALEPGRYQITVDDGSVLWRTELAVAEGSQTVLERASLVAVPVERTVPRGADEAAPDPYVHVPFDLGVFPPLSINGQAGRGKKVRNTASVSLVWARAAQLDGLALSTGLVFVDEHMHGAQLSLVGNVAGEAEGAQLSGTFNHARRIRGLQGAAAVNHAHELVMGAQLGMVNVGGKLRGAQVGLINVGREVKGAQVGLINIAGKADAAVGLLSITREGNVHPELSVSDTASLHVGLRLPARYTYSFLDVGIQPSGRGSGLQLGFGLGGRVPLPHRLFIDIDLAAYAVFPSFRTSAPSQLDKLRVAFGWQPYERLAVFGGPTLNVLIDGGGGGGQDAEMSDPVSRPGMYQWTPYDYTNTADALRVRVWPGFVGGVRF